MANKQEIDGFAKLHRLKAIRDTPLRGYSIEPTHFDTVSAWIDPREVTLEEISWATQHFDIVEKPKKFRHR
jgi:hypothetical protein